jgi:hypothetical protein
VARDQHLPDADAAPEIEDAETPTTILDPDRVVRVRTVFALVTLLIGALFILFASTVLALAFSGRTSFLFALAASLLALGVLSLLVRAPLRALSALRHSSDEIRAAAGFSSLASGILLFAASAMFLVFTFSVLLVEGGPTIVFILPLAALTYLTYGYVREATSDFTKKISLRRETILFLTSLGHFLFLFFVFIILAAASAASPVTLASPPPGSTICPGTPLNFSVNPAGIATITADNGTGPHPFTPPYQLPTTGFPNGPATITINITDNDGLHHSYPFPLNVSSTTPPCT